MFKCDILVLEKALIDFKISKYTTIIIMLSSLFKFGIIEGGTI
jgi:hypothetical protein